MRAIKLWKMALPPILLWMLVSSVAQSVRADALSDIKTRGELVIATDATYPPFEYKEEGELRGFDIELGNEIGKELGVKVRWLPLEWTGVLPSLETGKCDLVLSGVTITDERKQKGYGFSRPYFLSGQTIVRRRGDKRIGSLPDLKDKIVSVQAETTGQFALLKSGLPKEHLLKFETLQDGLFDLRNGKCDATVADLPALKAILRKSFHELELTGGIFTQENIGVVTRHGELSLISAVNTALGNIMVDGRYSRLYSRWMEEPLTTATIAGLDSVSNAGSQEVSIKTVAAPTDEPATDSAFTIRFDLLRKAFPLLMQGAEMTLLLTSFTLLLGIPVGLLVALARLSSVPPLRWLATAYVEVVRGTPLLMQIYVIYFVLPAIHLNLPSFAAGVAALSLNAAAYISEIFRAGIESIDSGQMEAARALGMDYPASMRWVILPQTLRRVLPPLTNESVALLKDSSLVSVVALSELMRVGKEFATNSGSPTTGYLAVALIYLVMTLPLTWLVRRLEVAWKPISKTQGKLKKESTYAVVK